MKRVLKRILRIYHVMRFNYYKTLLVNFRLLPFRQAIRFPIVVYAPCETLIRRSRLIFADDLKLTFGLVALGRNDDKFVSSKNPLFIMLLDSLIYVSGEFRLSPGCTIRMDHGCLSLGKHSAIGGGSMLLCNNRITIGDYVQFAFRCVCCDTDYHYISANNKVNDCKATVVIGDRTWIGNNCSIGKGTVLPSSSILASRSMTNKDYSQFEPGSLFVGTPARCFKTGCFRIHDKDIERRIRDYYSESTEVYHITKEEFDLSQYR